MSVKVLYLNNEKKKIESQISFLSDPGKYGVRSMCPNVTQSVSSFPFWDFTDIILADEDTKSILTDDIKY